jgi:hypothetical protein
MTVLIKGDQVFELGEGEGEAAHELLRSVLRISQKTAVFHL